MVLQRYMYGTAFANRSRMLNGVSDQFVRDKCERHSYVSRDSDWIGINDKRPHLIRAARRSRYLFAKIIDVPVEYYGPNGVKFVKLLVNGGDGRDTRRSVIELTCCGTGCLCLQIKKARHNLQAVLNSVVDLLHQEVFLAPAFLKRSFCFLKFLPLVEIAQ